LNFLMRKFLSVRLGLYVGYLLLLYGAIVGTEPQAFPLIILSNYLWPFATIVFSVIIFKLPVDVKKLSIGLTLAFLGVFLELGGSHLLEIPTPPLYCTILAIVAALVWGLYSSVNRAIGERSGGVQSLAILMGIAAVIMLLIGRLRAEPMNIALVPKPIFILYCIMPFLGNLCWDIGTRKGNLVILGFVADLTPWISLVTAAVFLGSPLHPSLFIAAFCILLGAWICRTM